MSEKISQYSTSVSSLATGDLMDVSKLISTSPNVYQSQKLNYSVLISELNNDLTFNNLGNSDLTSTANARYFYLNGNTSSNFLKVRNSDNISILSLFGDKSVVFGNVSNPVTMQFNIDAADSTGDIWYRNSGGNLQRLAIGSSNQVLTVAAGLPSWAASSSSNLGTSNLTAADDARTFTLKTGTTATQNFQFKNSSGTIGYYFDGADSLGFKTSTFATVGSGINQNFVIGSTTKPVVAALYLDTLTAGQYRAYEMFANTNKLYSIDSRGYYNYYSQDLNSNVDIKFNTYGANARIAISSASTGYYTQAFSFSGAGTELISLAGSNFFFSGLVNVKNDSGTLKSAIRANRAQGYLSWFGEGAQFGGTDNTFSASALVDMISTTQGLGIPSMTSAQRSAISSPREGLLVYQNDGTEAVYGYVNSAWQAFGSGNMVNVGTGTYTPNTSISGITRTTVTVTVTGALTTDKVVACINDAMRADFVTAVSWFLDMQAYVSAADTVTITYLISGYTTFGSSSSINVMVQR